MATQRKHAPRSRRRGGRLFHLYIILSALVIVAAVVAGSLVFFKAHTIEVSGNIRYSEDELKKAADIAEGTNLVTIPAREIARRMEQSMPYLKKVTIKRLPPETVVIQVEETVPAGAISAGGSVWYIDSGGKLLEQVSSNAGYPTVTGINIVEPEVGKLFAVSEDDSLKAKGLRGLLAGLEKEGLLSKVNQIDVTGASYLTMYYDKRLTVKMGLNDDFYYDMKMLKKVEGFIAENWSQGETGTLDMTVRVGNSVLDKDSVD